MTKCMCRQFCFVLFYEHWLQMNFNTMGLGGGQVNNTSIFQISIQPLRPSVRGTCYAGFQGWTWMKSWVPGSFLCKLPPRISGWFLLSCCLHIRGRWLLSYLLFLPFPGFWIHMDCFSHVGISSYQPLFLVCFHITANTFITGATDFDLPQIVLQLLASKHVANCSATLA